MISAARHDSLRLEERLRAVGWLLDDRGLHGISLAIGPGGVALVARRDGAGDAPPVRLRLSPAQLAVLCRHVRARRGRGGTPALAPRPSRLVALARGPRPLPPLSAWVAGDRPLPYQQALRAIGADLDRRGTRACRLDDFPGGLILGIVGATGTDVERVEVLARQQLVLRIAAAIRRRGRRTGSLPPAPARPAPS